MDVEALALKLQETTDRSERNEGRIKKLENEHEVLHKLATSVAVMAEKLDSMNKSLNVMTGKVEALEAEPAKKWRFIVEKTIYFVVGAVIAYILANLGLQ